MMKKNEDVLRVEAIRMVESVRPVVTDSEFIEYTYRAARVRSSKYDEGTENYKPVDVATAVFGDQKESILNRIHERATMFEILADTELPVAVRAFYVNNHLGGDISWDDFKSSMKA